MRKTYTLILSLMLCVIMVFTLAACGQRGVQGITVDRNDKTKGTILVGNTAASSGDYAQVGQPFNEGVKAYLHEYNQAGGYKQDDVTYSVRLQTYDDEFTASKGLTYTQKLVEQDKVFALLGHFGTNTVGATLDYIEEKGVPMFYAATGISALYNPNATGNARRIMPVQPIYEGEGSALLVTAFAPEPDGLAATKVGVIYSDDDAGHGIRDGVVAQAAKINRANAVVYQMLSPSATDAETQARAIKEANCDVVIIAANQAPLEIIGTGLKTVNYTGKMITSYVNSNATTMGSLANKGIITQERPMYATGWLNIVDPEGQSGFSADYWQFAATMNTYEQFKQNKAGDTSVYSPYAANAYAMAGYIAANMFCQVLDRVEASGEKLTWANFVDYAEEGPINIPMGESIDYSQGKRTGVTSLSLSSYTWDYTTITDGGTTTYSSTATLVRGLKSLSELEASLNQQQPEE